jgi:hypothetical protein
MRDKVLVTYDILENKGYKNVLALYKHLITWDSSGLVLPIQTPPQKLDEVLSKIKKI